MSGSEIVSHGGDDESRMRSVKIERVLANNPSPFTGPGTNTWILDDGTGVVVVIDPGPVDSDHADAIERMVGSRHVGQVLVTHTHLDHAPMANPLARVFSVPALGHRPGPQFVPDATLADGDVVLVGSAHLEVIHTPGHADDHLCFRVGDVLFSGDHIIGGSSVMVETMGPYLASLERLKGTGLRRLHPGHGEDMEDPDVVIDWYLAHRRQRHQEICQTISAGAETLDQVVETVYTDVDQAVLPLAAQSVRAHLALLIEEGRIAFSGDRIVPLPPEAP
jgi:glyoxylase-like metal-dependent hydrolase (beta-lactamase superfamily II)